MSGLFDTLPLKPARNSDALNSLTGDGRLMWHKVWEEQNPTGCWLLMADGVQNRPDRVEDRNLLNLTAWYLKLR